MDEKLNIQFKGGEGCIFNGGVNFMMSDDGKFYAETPIIDESVEENYGYFSLKNAIVDLAKQNGISPDRLIFWYDGQEDYLSKDARREVEVRAEYSC